MENACLAHAVNAGCEVHYWREEPWEIDAVIRTGQAIRLVEIRTGRYSAEDLRGLSHAAARFPDCVPLVLCDPGEEPPAWAAGFEALPWPGFLASDPRAPS